MGLIASNGKVALLTDLPSIVYGDAISNGSSLSIMGSAYDGDTVETITFSGSVTAGASISASYTTSTESGSISLSTAPSAVGEYNRSSSLAKLAGTWNDSISDPEGTWVFSIGSQGAFTAARVTDNCTMSGNFQLIDATKNEYALTALVSDCDVANGSYEGLAFTSDANGMTDNVVSLIVAGDTTAGVFEAVRQ